MKGGGGKQGRKKNMASKAQLSSPVPSEEKKQREPSSGDHEEEESEELQSVSVSAGEENANLSGVKAEDGDRKMAKSRDNSQEIWSDSDSDLGSPSDYMLQPILKTPKSSSKRVHDEKGRNQPPARELKNQKTGEGTKTPGGCITRLWSDEDEITLLNEMVAFRDAKGREPSTNMEAFYDSNKGKLKVEFSKDQVKGKFRRLRKKFFNALENSKNGEGSVFSNPHEDKLFELSKKIWGSPLGNTRKKNLDKNVNKEEKKKKTREPSFQEEEEETREPSFQEEEEETREPSFQEEEQEQETREPSFQEEEEDDDDEKEKVDDPKMEKSRGDNQKIRSDSDSDGGLPSDYKLQPILKTPKSSYKRVRHEKGQNQMQAREVKKHKTGEGMKTREAKKQKIEEGTKTPGGCITRLWSTEDEVIVLNEMVTFREANGQDPSTNMVAFFDFIKGKLKVEFSKDQVKGKIKRLQKRFFNSLKNDNNGEHPVFSNPHEDKLFVLSMKIWGSSIGNTRKSNKNGENLEQNVNKEEKEKTEEPSSEEEEEEMQSDSVHAREEKANLSGEKAENDDPKMATPRDDNQEMGSDSDSDGGLPSDYKLQPILKTPKSSSKRVHDKKRQNRTPARDVKKQRTGEGTKTPGGCITRLWSNEDEVMVLNGMIAFREAKARDPTTDMVAFSDFIKGKLKVEFSKDQVKGKIKRLEKRFFNALKNSNNGEDPIFSNPHEDKLFELSKKIWDSSVGNTSKSVNKGEKADRNVDKKEKGAEVMGTEKEQELHEMLKKTEKENVVKKSTVNGANTKNYKDAMADYTRFLQMRSKLSGLDDNTLLTGNLLLEEGGMGLEERKAWKKLLIEEMETFVRLWEVKTQQQTFLLQRVNG